MRVTYQITNMHCSNCVMHLEALEDEIPGILLVKGSYLKQNLVVDFDERIINETQIRTAIQELGYIPQSS